MSIVTVPQIEKVIDQKVVERVRLLPTVHEVTKTVHQITELESPGIEVSKTA